MNERMIKRVRMRKMIKERSRSSRRRRRRNNRTAR